MRSMALMFGLCLMQVLIFRAWNWIQLMGEWGKGEARMKVCVCSGEWCE